MSLWRFLSKLTRAAESIRIQLRQSSSEVTERSRELGA